MTEKEYIHLKKIFYLKSKELNELEEILTKYEIENMGKNNDIEENQQRED